MNMVPVNMHSLGDFRHQNLAYAGAYEFERRKEEYGGLSSAPIQGKM